MNHPTRAASKAERSRAKVITPAVPPIETRRRARHLDELFRNLELPSESATWWTITFDDEKDPLFIVADWVRAGWRDPHVVRACLTICGTREHAEQCFDALDWEYSREWDELLPDLLLEAMERVA